jgi:hypothetical protein
MHYGFYPLDISNAFQNTPAPPNAAGNRIWLKVFPEYMLWYQTRFPVQYKTIEHTFPPSKQSWKSLGVEMFAHVQGRKDASREWREQVDKVLVCGQLGLIKSRADQCIYQGTINQCHVILARSSDDILVVTLSLDTYNHIVTTLESHWKIPNMGQSSLSFFGLRSLFVSIRTMTIHQTYMVHEVRSSICLLFILG